MPLTRAPGPGSGQRDRLPASWQAAVSRPSAPYPASHAELGTLAERGHAYYGDEVELVPPSELFERSEAEEAIDTVGRLLALYRELVTC